MVEQSPTQMPEPFYKEFATFCPEYLRMNPVVSPIYEEFPQKEYTVTEHSHFIDFNNIWYSIGFCSTDGRF